MEPEGYLIVNVREISLSPLVEAFQERCQTYKYEFKNIRSWKRELWGILILEKDGSTIGYPWTMIEQYVCKPNSDEYVAWYREQNG